MRRHLVQTCLIGLSLVAAPVAWAEGSGHALTGEDTPAKPKVVRRAKPKPKPAPVLTTPTRPIPYTALSGEAPKAETVTTVSVAPTAYVPPPPPLPQPTPVYPAPVPEVSVPGPQSTTISLKCDTTVVNGDKVTSAGTFFIEMTPSPVFPDAHASFRVRRVDSGHASLVRDTMCLDTACSAQVSPTVYDLMSRVDEDGEALRITLDRTGGRFMAEAITKRLVGGTHRAETGWCVAQPRPKALF